MENEINYDEVFKVTLNTLTPQKCFLPIHIDNNSGTTVNFISRLDKVSKVREWKLFNEKEIYYPEKENTKNFKVKPGSYVVLPHCFYTQHPVDESKLFSLKTRAKHEL